jgi:DNA polymerase-3 subunit chi
VTEVEFHTGVADRLDLACRLLRKAYRQGVRVQVTARADELAALDRALWAFDERDFVPHLRVPAADPQRAARTPIWLALQATAEAAPRVLVNLGADAPQDLGALERLIEIVSLEPEDAARGRERWRGYKAAGLAIKHHSAGAGRE